MNNNVDNLEWISHSDNNEHAYKNNLTKFDYKGDIVIEFFDGTIKTYSNHRLCARELGTSHTNIRNWLNRDSKIKFYENFGIKRIYYKNW